MNTEESDPTELPTLSYDLIDFLDRLYPPSEVYHMMKLGKSTSEIERFFGKRELIDELVQLREASKR